MTGSFTRKRKIFRKLFLLIATLSQLGQLCASSTTEPTSTSTTLTSMTTTSNWTIPTSSSTSSITSNPTSSTTLNPTTSTTSNLMIPTTTSTSLTTSNPTTSTTSNSTIPTNSTSSTTSTPTTSTTSNPTTPTTSNPSTATTSNPSTPTTSNPTTPTTSNPTTAATSNPSTATTSNPTTPTTSNPSTATTSNPSTATTSNPTTPTTSNPSTPTTSNPSTAATSNLSTVTTSNPTTPTTSNPTTATTSNPSTATKSNPSPSTTSNPTTSTTSNPTSTTSKSMTSTTVNPSSSTTSKVTFVSTGSTQQQTTITSAVSIAECGKNLDIEHGFVTYTNTTVNGTATFSCDAGYHLEGENETVCQDIGVWVSTNSKCSVSDCGKMLDIEHGFVTYTNTTVNGTATFSCDVGYHLEGENETVCQDIGVWVPTNSKCSVNECGKMLDIEHGFVTYTNTTVNGTATFSCDVGYHLEGENETVCQDIGVWVSTNSKCSVNVNGTATFSCDVGYHLEGENETVCQDIGVWVSTNSKCSVNDCGNLSMIPHGSVNYKNTTVNATAEYSCDIGYHLKGENQTECQENGAWISTSSKCEVNDCGKNLDIEHGFVTYTNTTVNGTATFSCDVGYHLEGENETVCQDIGVWVSTNSKCSVNDCGNLSMIPHGSVNYKNTTVNTTAEYSCDIGYHLKGENQTECQENGAWISTSSKCEVNDCGKNLDIEHGFVTYTNTTVNGTATFSCDVGYHLEGENETVCQDIGVWVSTNSKCSVNDCGNPSMIPHGSVNYKNTTVNATAEYSCEIGYHLKGENQTECQENGAWISTSSKCEVNDCGKNLNIEHGFVTYTNTTVNGTATFSCDVGYHLEGENETVCQDIGVWVSTNSKCSVNDCGNPAEIQNGFVTYTSTTVNATVNYTCDIGYHLEGENETKCQQNAVWMSTNSTCKVNDCGKLTAILNGRVTFINTTVNSTASYICDFGYYLNGENVIYCQENGTWLPLPPVCEINDCGPPSHANNSVATYDATTVNSSVVFSCVAGFFLEGQNSSICQENGSWSFTETLCIPKDCGDPAQPENGNVTYNETTFNATAVFGCNKGYNHSDNNVLRCGENGTWTDALPKCDIVDCGRPSDIDNGSFYLRGNTSYTSIAVYACNSSYKLNGTSNLRSCLANGTWSSQVGPCVPLECPILSNPTHGTVNSSTLKAVFSCEEGYSLIGWRTVTCLYSGNWSGPSPKCEKIAVSAKNCTKEIDLRDTEWKETRPGETADKPCKEGFEGIISRNCTKQGVWKPPRYSCVKVEIELANNKIISIENNATSKEKKSAAITDVLGTLSSSTNSSSTTSTGGNALFDGEIEKVTSILDKVASISKDIAVTEKQSEDFIGTTSNLLNPENSESYKSIAENSENQDGKKAEGADKVLEVVGKFAKAIANSLNTTNGTRTVKKDNLLMTVSQLNGARDVHFPEEKQNTSSSVKISEEALKGVGSYSGILYRNLSGLLPSKLDDNGNVDNNMFQINAAVMDVQLLQTKEIPLNFEITLNFENFVKGNYNSKCSFWNFSKSSWDTSGCSLVEEKTNSSMTVCTCSHTTNFAILMNPSKTPNVESKALDYISIIGCSVSFVCLVITVVMHTVLWRYLKSDRAKILMNLSIALILSYAIFLAGVDRTENKAVCTTIAVALHYIYLVVFFLMLSEGIEILITVLFVFVVKSRLRWLLGMSWGLPIIIVAVSVGATRTRGYGTETFCWLSVNSGLIWAFVGPALLVILANFVQLVIVMRTMFQVKTLKEKARAEKVKTGVRCLCVLLPLTGGTWVIGVFYVNESLAWIQYLFAILNSLQGLFIMLFHCIFNSQMRLAISRRRKKYLASTSFTGSSSKPVSIPRPTKTTGVYNDLFGSSTDYTLDFSQSMPRSQFNGYYMKPRDDERRQHRRYLNSDI